MKKTITLTTICTIAGLIFSTFGAVGAIQFEKDTSVEKNLHINRETKTLFVSPFTPPSFDEVIVDWIAPTTGVSIAVDTADNVYTVYYEYNLGEEITLTKRDVNGNFLWEASYDQTDPTKWEKATWVTTDNENNILVSGTLMSGYSNPVNAASILMKYTPAGNLLWRQVYESTFDGSYTKKCLVDATNNIYVLGMGSGPAGYVTKIKKFASNGSPLWSYFDADGIGAPVNFKFTPDGSIVVACRSIYGSVNGYTKIDVNGNKIWSYPGVYSLTVGDASGDISGNTFLVHGEYVMNTGTVIKKVDQSGNLIWENVYAISGFRIEVGTDNCAVISGYPNQGTAGAAFIKVNGNGELLWANLDADGPLALMLHARMLLDENNDAYLAAGTLFEMAVCKVNNDGTSEWTQTLPGSYANDITLGNDGYSIFVVGLNTARLIWNSSTNSPPSFGTPNPINVSIGQPLSFTWSIPISDHEGDQFIWTIQCSNGQLNSGTGATNGTKTLSLSGLTYLTTYTVWANATDPVGSGGSGDYKRAWFIFTTIDQQPNNPPDKPETPTGTLNGKINILYTYTTSTADLDGDQVYYNWSWGDGTYSGWLGPFTSGAVATAQHKWTTKATYQIKVKAIDTNGDESVWSEPLPISMPTSLNQPMFRFLEQLFERFPNAFPALQHLMGY